MQRPSKRFLTVLIFELIALSIVFLIGFTFWQNVCGDAGMADCLKDSSSPYLTFLFLSLIRPLFFSPVLLLAFVAGGYFGSFWGAVLTALGSGLSSLCIYYPAHVFGKKMVRPWLLSNLPNTWRLIRTQDYKIVFISHWIPIFPTDLLSFLFGIADFHARRVFLFTALGSFPTIFLFSSLANAGNSDSILAPLLEIIGYGILTSLPLLCYEFLYRKKKGSLWTRIKRVYYEIFYEVKVNNEIRREDRFQPGTTPVILLYGFFSSRKTLSVLEKLLVQRGFEVMSFNLGGFFDVFFTRGIRETAEFLNQKIRRQMAKHGFEKVAIVGHSKGGLVALWWLLRLGGHRHCDKVITMGTPFKGSYLTYLLLFTPLGFFWKDIWQMRPGSKFLNTLHDSPVYENVTIFNLYSIKDKVAVGKEGVFEYPGRVIPVPMHHMAHFEYLYRRSIGDVLSGLLKSEQATEEQINSDQTESLEVKS